MRSSLIFLAFLAAPAWAQVTVEQPWSRATPPGAEIGAGFMTLKNAGASAARVVGASSPAAARVEMHVTTHEGNVMQMREVPAYEVPAGGTFVLAPGGAHLMLFGLKRPLQAGERVPLTLKLEGGGEVKAELQVQKLGARAPGHHHH